MHIRLKFSLQKQNSLKKNENDYYVRVFAKVIEAMTASFDWKSA